MNGEEIKAQVQIWLKGADAAIVEVEKVIDDFKLNKRCFWGCCPDCTSRYKLSRKAVKDAVTIGELQDKGKFDRVSLQIRKPLEIESMISREIFEAFESTQQAMNEVMKALRDDNVNVIGVYGMGGVGKTTMVEQMIQGQIADMLAVKLDDETEAGRAGHLKERIMRGRRILIFLDDLWGRIELAKIGVPSGRDLEACKSKIILTTRLENDSWRLFRKKAGNAVDSPDFHDVAWRVVKECGGLPIALVVVARALGDKDLEEWKEAARQLEMSNPTKDDHDHTVFRCIKFSYDYLKHEDAKRCFLNCCLFPEDTNINIEDLVKYGIGQGLFQNANTVEEARAAASSLLKHLKACSLLLNSDQEGCVKMHDVVRDTAISIASAGDELAFLVHSGAALKKWQGGTAMRLHSHLTHNNIDIQEIPDGFFERMESLRVLDVNGADISSLPSSLGLLLNLRTLCLDGCKSTDISILGELRKLEILSLRESCIEELPRRNRKLVSLRMLDFTMSSDLKRIRRFDELTRLPYLNTLKVDITDAGCIPQTVVSNPNWVKFNICMSEDLFVRLMDVHLSKIMAARSRALILNTTINTLPDWFNSVVTEKTEKLFYIHGSGLHNIISEYDQGEQCDELVGTLLQPNLLKRLENLEVLDVSGNSLEDIFRVMDRGLWWFRGIIGEDKGEASSNMSHKSRVKEIVEKQKEEAMEKIILPQLKNLSLQNLPLLTGFYSGFASIQCPSLEQLHTQDCPLFRATQMNFTAESKSK
ncbi:Disease resistance protein [Vitis vinifera]|uniref:Disease resistance protein n=1 Tax=Vitis vinifera TaxID=29760 RepID=A0A438JFF0_VITVI|nr:Disease resistance protein [Vitis vinifera]